MEGKRTGWEHFAEADWAAARHVFAAVLERDPDDAEALDGLGQSLWWLGDRDAGIGRRRDAYAAYQRRGDARNAGRVAIYLAGEHRIDGRKAEAAGWLSRARRLLEGQGTVSELGWMAIEEAKRAADPPAAERHARVALKVAHELGDPDVECMALAQLGRAVVGQGRVEEGIALLDEAMTVALGGETTDPLACGDACCTTLLCATGSPTSTGPCSGARRSWSSQSAVASRRSSRGAGASTAPSSSEQAIGSAPRRSSPRRCGDAGSGARAGAARSRSRSSPSCGCARGLTEEAEELLSGLEDEPAALAPLVQLHVQRGNPAIAQALLDRRAAVGGDEGQILVLRGALALATGDLAATADAAGRLREVAVRLARGELAAEAALVAGRVAAAG